MKKYSLSFILTALLSLYLIGFAGAALSAPAFTVEHIQFRGLHRIGRDTVETYLPVTTGEVITAKKTADILRGLYKTEFFSDVQLVRHSNTLIIYVVERPVIADIAITGNRSIPKKPFDAMVTSTGLVRGRIFNRDMLEQVKLLLLNQYKMQSLYNAKVNIHVKPLPRNRVSIRVHIREGKPARIRTLRIVGNKAFSDAKLIRSMGLSTTHLWSWFTKGDYYSQDKLDKGLDALRNFYLNRGYLEFKIRSHDVKLTAHNQRVAITVYVYEGPIYRLGAIKLTGDMKGYEHSIRKQITLKPGQIFSREALVKAQKDVIHYLAEKGYAFAEVHVQSHANASAGHIDITLQVVPGRYVYIRQIHFKGNKKTEDEVLRREMRQVEGSVLSLSKIKESKRRLANLGYLEDIKMNLKPVPSKPDQVDVDYTVKETSSAKASIQVGLSDTEGLLYGASLSQRNFMGTGKAVDLSFDRSAYRRTFSFFYNNPYYTRFGVSRGFNLYAERTTPGRTNISSYKTNTYGGSVHYGIPFTKYSRLTTALGYEHIELNSSADASLEVRNFITRNGGKPGIEAAIFDQFKLITAWVYSTYDRGVFPTKGYKGILTGEIGLPAGGRPLDYYLLNYHAALYQPLSYGFIFTTHLRLGYGRGYSRTGSDLPLFKNYYAGGIGSVRGYEGNTLGPLDSKGYALGGNVLTTGSLGIILPPYLGDKLRATLFVDAGMVDKNRLGDLRYSAGIMIEWHTPMAPIEFSFAKPLDKKRGDKVAFFQFSFGSTF